MTRFIKGLLSVVLFAVGAASCEREEMHQTEQTGYLYIDLQKDFTVDPVFKSQSAEDMVFSIAIYDWNDEIVATYDDHRQLAAEPLELRAGPYRVTAEYGAKPLAACQQAVFHRFKELFLGLVRETVIPVSKIAFNVLPIFTGALLKHLAHRQSPPS